MTAFTFSSRTVVCFLVVFYTRASLSCTCPAEAPFCYRGTVGDNYCYPACLAVRNGLCPFRPNSQSGTRNSDCSSSFSGGTCSASHTQACPTSHPICLKADGMVLSYHDAVGTHCASATPRSSAECTLCCYPSSAREGCSANAQSPYGVVTVGDCTSADGPCGSKLNAEGLVGTGLTGVGQSMHRFSCDAGVQNCGGAAVDSIVPTVCTAHANGNGGGLSSSLSYQQPRTPPAPPFSPLPPRPPPGTGFVSVSTYYFATCATDVLAATFLSFVPQTARTCSTSGFDFDHVYACGTDGSGLSTYYCAVTCTADGQASVQRYSRSGATINGLNSCSTASSQSFATQTCVTNAEYMPSISHGSSASYSAFRFDFCHTTLFLPLPPPLPLPRPPPPSPSPPPPSPPLPSPSPLLPSPSPHPPSSSNLDDEAGSQSSSTISIRFTLSGDASSFGATERTIIQNVFASAAGVVTHAVEVTIVSASISVLVTITVATARLASSTQTTLSSGIVSSASTLETALTAGANGMLGLSSVTVEAMPSSSLHVWSPPPPSRTPYPPPWLSPVGSQSSDGGGNTGVMVGAVVGVVCVTLLGVGVYFWNKKRRPTTPSKSATSLATSSLASGDLSA